jgi:hypothetical protein
MLNNPMGQRRDQPQSGNHVCIFELERKRNFLTANVVCTVCGVYLCSEQDRQQGTRQGRTGKSATVRHL